MCVKSYLEIEHAGLVRGLDGRVLGSLLEESVELYRLQSVLCDSSHVAFAVLLVYLEELVIRRLGLELAAVLDGLLELCGLGDHVD